MTATPIQTGPRTPAQVMRLDRLGASFPTRLSFMRVLLRRLMAEKTTVTRPVWQIDDQGFGRAVYTLTLGGFTYSLVAFSTPLAPENRTDRVIAEAWDTSYVLFDGIPASADLDRLQTNAPKQEAGRFTSKELVLCRANKSVRMFDHVVDCLAKGEQPAADQVQSVGYLMRTTAVYGNGKFGIADRALFAGRPGLGGPFAAEMLAVWLVRAFTLDLVEHVAHQKGGAAFVPLDAHLKRHFGVGNATGLGMAPFLFSHPVLLNNWIAARETALARVSACKAATADEIAATLSLIARASRHLAQWNVADSLQMGRITDLRREWAAIAETVNTNWLTKDHPWQRLQALADKKSLECQELMVALLLEPHGDLVDDLAGDMATDTRGGFDTALTVGAMRALLEAHFDWALSVDFSDPLQQQQFWYVSVEKLEPRLGDRYGEAGSELESPLDIARRAQALAQDFNLANPVETLAEFLLRHPDHRFLARRVQLAAQYPYSELRDNLIADTCLPIDMLRCKLAFFGASKFDPKSDRWTRITMYQGAPLTEDIAGAKDDWWLPVLRGVQ